MNSPSFEEIYEPLMKLQDICGDTIPLSEIYNETWMLRLVLSLLSKVVVDSNTFTDSQSDNHLRDVCMAVKSGWISEGGLKPIFKQESTTWTDAIVGAVQKSSRNRNSEKNETAIYKGVIVIEAKMGSNLSAGGSRLKGYNQVARNIACLARFIIERQINPKQSKFLVFAPRKKINHWDELDKENYNNATRIYSPDAMMEHIKSVLCDKETKKWKYSLNNEILKKYENTIEKYWADIIECAIKICHNSSNCVISWESILEFFDKYAHKNFSRLEEYYKTTKKIYDIQDEEDEKIQVI